MDEKTKQFLEEQFSRVDERFVSIEGRMATKEDLSALDSRMATLDSRMATKEDLADIGAAVSALATHIDERFDEIDPLLTKMDNYDKRLKYVEDRLTTLSRP